MANIHGNPSGAFLVATAEIGEIYGGAGNDTVVAGDAGDDVISVDVMGDSVVGGDADDDLLDGGADDDNLGGGAAADLMVGGTGNTSTAGGVGHESFPAGSGHDSVQGSVVRIDSLVGGVDNNAYLISRGFNQVVAAVYGGIARRSTSVISVNLANSANIEGVTLFGKLVLNATGTAANESLYGNVAVNMLTGGGWPRNAGSGATFQGLQSQTECNPQAIWGESLTPFLTPRYTPMLSAFYCRFNADLRPQSTERYHGNSERHPRQRQSAEWHGRR